MVMTNYNLRMTTQLNTITKRDEYLLWNDVTSNEFWITFESKKDCLETIERLLTMQGILLRTGGYYDDDDE